jgi:hypothetical protein
VQGGRSGGSAPRRCDPLNPACPAPARSPPPPQYGLPALFEKEGLDDDDEGHGHGHH